MSRKGCTFNGGSCHPVVEKCQGCDRIQVYPNGTYCKPFPDPTVKWGRGVCNMATHFKDAGRNGAEKVRVGQQKQKKKK